MSELREGMQVRIKSVHEYYDDIRDVTLTLIERFDEGGGECWYVDFDGRKDDWVVGEDDVYRANVKVIEGVVSHSPSEGHFIETPHLPTDETVDAIFANFYGKRVRITIEEVSP